MCYVCKSGGFPKVADLKVLNWWFCEDISGDFYGFCLKKAG